MNKILDLDDEQVLSLQLINIPPPHFFFDTLKDKELEPEIKIEEDMNFLKDIEFVLYAKPISKKESWAKRQNSILYLRPEESPKEEDFRILNKLPSNHYFEVDVANYKVRITGPFVSKNHVGPWLHY